MTKQLLQPTIKQQRAPVIIFFLLLTNSASSILHAKKAEKNTVQTQEQKMPLTEKADQKSISSLVSNVINEITGNPITFNHDVTITPDYKLEVDTIQASNNNLLINSNITGKNLMVDTIQSSNNNLLIASNLVVGSPTRTTVPSLTVTGNAVVLGSFVLDNTRFFFSKLPSALTTSPTTVLSITFTDFAGQSGTPAQGAFVKMQCFINGTISSTPSELFFEGDYYIMPGASGSSPCTRSVINEYAVSPLGNSVTLTSDLTGTGTGARMQLKSSSTISSQNFLMFYEVTSGNLQSAA